MKKAVFITGAHSGTGYRIAQVFAEKGYDVFLTSRRGPDAEQAAKAIAEDYGVFAKGYECNIRNEQQVIDIFKDIDACGRFVEALILNAANMGFYPRDPAAGQDFWTVPLEDVAEVFETNLVWNFSIVRQAAIRMRKQGGGSVVFISSNTAYRAIPNRAAYSASKGGINALVKALAVDLGPSAFVVTWFSPAPSKPNAGCKWETSKSSTESLPPSETFPILTILPTPAGSSQQSFPRILRGRSW